MNKVINIPKNNTFVKDFLLYARTVAVTVVLMTCVFSINKVPSTSMKPTISPNSLIINWRLPYLLSNPMPKHGDIIIFQSPDEAKLLVKRVIGLPGDRISFADGYVFRNGEKLDEPYLAEQGRTFSSELEYEVPAGMLFVMGDNREHSRDSRFMTSTFIPVESVQAKNMFSFRSLL